MTPNSDKHLISPYNITPESNIWVTRIKEIITNWRSSWFLNKFLLVNILGNESQCFQWITQVYLWGKELRGVLMGVEPMTSQLVHVLWMLYHWATEDLWQAWQFNPFPPNAIIHILHTVLSTFPRVLTRRICLLIKSFLVLVIISFILMTLTCDSGVIL